VRYELAIFDFDGTLVDSFPVIARVANDALGSLGFPARSISDVRPLVGMSLETVMERLSGSSAEAEELSVRYRAIWDETAEPAPLYGGMRDLLDVLLAAGVRLAVATNRKRFGLEELLVAHGLREHFHALVGASCVDNRKPHPESVDRILGEVGVGRERCVVIGDTTLDIVMGRNAGTHTCAVTYGAQAREVLAAEQPTYLVDRVADLGGVLGF